jgi:hypothetical protein
MNPRIVLVCSERFHHFALAKQLNRSGFPGGSNP